MSYIFFSDNKWFLHPGDLPVRPNDPLKYGFTVEMDEYNQSIADIKAKALEIANPEILDSEFDTAFIIENANILTPKVDFYQWPGTFEKKETLYANDKYEVKYKKEVAHLVLPPEEKNMDEMYYLNGPDEFVNPNESTSSQEEKKTVSFERAFKLLQECHKLEDELAACRQSLAELIPIAERYAHYYFTVHDNEDFGTVEKVKSAIERAKALIK
jgi:hypothetical protein